MPEKVRKSGQALEKGLSKLRRRVRASTGKGWIRVSTEKGRITASVKKVESGRVPEKGLGEYRERVESEQVSKK